MLTRKSGILALVVGAMFLGACESKTPIVNVTTPTQTNPVTVTISPNPVPQLNPAQTIQLTAVVANASAQTVTWTSSNTAVATVSASGLVTAVASGVASVKAVSTADPNAQSSVAISVAAGNGGNTGGGNPTVSINSVTQGGTLFPVNPGAVAGTVDVSVTYDIPAGTSVSAVRVTVDGTEVCRQSFNNSGSTDASIEAVPQTFICSINTARLGTNGVASFLNGTHTLKAEVLNATGGVAASATYQTLTFANADVIAVAITTSKAPVADQNGFSWRAGDVTATLTPAIYTGAANQPTSLNITLVPSTFAAIQGTAGSANADFSAACSPTRTTVAGLGAAPTRAAAGCAAVAAGATKTVSTFTNNAGTATWSAGTRFASGGVGFMEDPGVTFAVTGLTASGNNVVATPVFTIDGVAITAAAGATPLRLDNLAPRVTTLDITPANITALTGNPCAPSTSCYLNGTFAFSAANNAAIGSNIAQTVDYGVDRQTTTFVAGPTAATATAVSNPSGMPETAVSNTNILGLVTTDAQGNTRTLYATANPVCPSTSSTSGAAANLQGASPACAATTIQTFGVDLTPPTMATAGLANNSTAATAAAANTWTFTASDASTPPAGPSGISGILVTLELINATGTTCYDPSVAPATALASCSAQPTLVANGTVVTVPGATEGYWRVTATPVDLAGNLGTTVTRVHLRDFTAPTVGGIASPSSITGNTDVSFTVFASDNLDLGDLQATVQYTGAGVELNNSTTTIGTYGADVLTLNNAAAPTFVVNSFIRSIETTTVAGAPTGAASLADNINAYVRDVAGVALANQCVVGVASPAPNTSTQNCTRRQDPILANVQLGIGGVAEPTTYASAGRPFGTGTNNGGTAFSLTGNNATVCSNTAAVAAGGAAGCPTNPTTTTLTATAVGPALTFANPFARVLFYYTDPTSGRSFQICSSSATSVTDNTTVGTRTWSYTCTFAPALAAGPYSTFALGVDSSGRALMTQPFVVTVAVD